MQELTERVEELLKIYNLKEKRLPRKFTSIPFSHSNYSMIESTRSAIRNWTVAPTAAIRSVCGLL